MKLHKIGISRSVESRLKMSEAQRGRRHSEETRRKMSESHKRIGHKHSVETRRRISETKKLYYKNKQGEKR